MSTTIELKSISKYFGSVIALKDISISVNSGEVSVFWGTMVQENQPSSKPLPGFISLMKEICFWKAKNPLRFPKRCPGPRYCNRLSGSCPGPSDECYPEFFHGP